MTRALAIAAVMCAALGAAEPTPFRVAAAERYDPEFDPHRMHLLSQSSKGGWVVAPDSRHLLYVESGKLLSIGLDGQQRRLLFDDLPAAQLVVTPDGKYVVMQGGRAGALTRVLIGGGSRLDIGKGLRMHDLSGLVVSPDSAWIAFTTAEGPMVAAEVLEGTAHPLDVPPPATGQCHAGMGYVRAFTVDSKRLLYQHGCYDSELIGRDGSGRVSLAKSSLTLAGDVAIGQGSNGFEVLPLAGGEPSALDTVKLDGLSAPAVAPGNQAFAFRAAGGAVYVARLSTKKVSRVSPEGIEGLGFFSFTPDGAALLWPGRKGKDRCEAHRFDLATGRDTLLVALDGTGQCFVKAAGNTQAVVNAYHGQMSLFAVDLRSLVVRSLGAPLPTAGNVSVSSDGRWVVVESRARETGSVWSIDLRPPEGG